MGDSDAWRSRVAGALPEAEARYEALFNALDAAVLLMHDDECVECNPATLTLFGLSAKEEILGRTPLDFAPPRQPDGRLSAEAIRENTAQAINKGLHVFEWQSIRKGGEPFLMEVRFTPCRFGGELYFQCIAIDITERKRIEQALRESEATYRTLFDSATDGILILDMGGRIVDANRTAHERLGYTREEFLTLDIRRLDHPDFAPRVPERQRQIRERGVAVFESGHLRKDGSMMPVEVNSRLLEYRGQRVFYSFVRDITERKRAQEENDRLARAISIATEGIAVTDGQDRFVYVNDAHARIYGSTPLDLIGKSWRDVTPAELVPVIEPELTRSLHNPECGRWSGECPALRVDGIRIDTEVTAAARWGKRGEYAGHICVVRDVTERTRAREALRASEARFRTIIESASVGIVLADMETRRHVYANPEACRLFGYSREELLALEIDTLHPPEELPRVRASFAAREGIQTLCRRKDGSDFPADIRAVPMELDGAMRLAGFFTDLTVRRQLEEERLKTQKLESVGTLAGGIAHDFNNLLQGVFGYLSMARLTYDRREKSLAMLEQAEKALHQSVSLAAQLLTFSKGGMPVKRLLDIRPVVENACRFALSGARSHFRFSAAADLWCVEADEGQIGQVVQNLVLNADQAMPAGGTVEVSAGNVPAAAAAAVAGLGRADHLRIDITDGGIGIPAEYLGKVFDPYFTTKEKGSGLGLATSYSIVRNHGGTITVASQRGRGTTFTVYLPATRTPAAAAVPEEPKETAPARPRRAARVLVMDDEPVVRSVAEELLRALGHEVEVAGDGAEAVEMCRRAREEGRPFEVAILDLTVRGGMGGAEAVRGIAGVDPAVRTVVSSGYSGDDVLTTYRAHGFDAVLKKPYALAGLRAVLEELLEEGCSGRRA